MRHLHLLILTALGAWLLAACGQPATQAPTAAATKIGKPVAVVGAGTYIDITPTELYAMLRQKDFVFVNVHIPFEGDIANTDVSIPYNEIDKYLGQLPTDKDAKIVLYCRSDRISREAAQELVKRGFTRVFQLEGGMLAWQKDGYPLIGK